MPETVCLAVSWIGSGPPCHHCLCWVAFQVRCLPSLLPRYQTSLWRAPRSFLCQLAILSSAEKVKMNPTFSQLQTSLPQPQILRHLPRLQLRHAHTCLFQSYLNELSICRHHRVLSPSVTKVQEQAEGCTWVAV